VEVDGQSRKKANLDKSDSQPSPSTSSGQALRDWSRYTLIAGFSSASALRIGRSKKTNLDKTG
jgi:hypothetical protein